VHFANFPKLCFSGLIAFDLKSFGRVLLKANLLRLGQKAELPGMDKLSFTAGTAASKKQGSPKIKMRSSFETASSIAFWHLRWRSKTAGFEFP
jgi:hypothetical protein